MNNQYRVLRTDALEGVQGIVNYIPNAEFEDNTTNGWSLGTTGTLTNAIPTGSPTFGSGASGNLSIAAASSAQIRGGFYMTYVSSAATTAGNMVHTNSIALNVADQAKVLTFKFYYRATTNPTNANWSGTSSNSLGVAVYDTTNSVWLPVAGNFAMTQSTGIGIATGTVQTGSSTGNIRFCVYNANATSGAVTVDFDDIYLGPQTAPIGPVVTDWQTYTPTVTYSTGGATNVTHVGKYRRVGDAIELEVASTFSNTSSAFTRPTYSLPPGLSIDTTKMASGAVAQSAGYSRCEDSGNNAYVGGLTYLSTTTVYPFAFLASGTSVSFEEISATVPFTFNASDSIFIKTDPLPVVGWSSNVQMSNDTDTRVVAMRANRSSTQSINNSSTTDVVYSSTIFDTAGSYNSSTGVYTIGTTGYYRISASADFATNSTGLRSLDIAGTNSANLLLISNPASGNITVLSGSTTLKYSAGDTVKITCFQSSGAGLNIAGGGVVYNYFTVERLSGPAVIAATESVNARYFASATSITGSLATISWTTKDFDSHNGMSSGTYTVPVSGKYQVNTSVAVSGTFALNNQTNMVIQKNGSTVSELLDYAAGAETADHVMLTDIISCNAGDTLRVQLSSGATGPGIVSSNTKNYISIARVGN